MRIFHTRKVTIFSAMRVPHAVPLHSTRRCTPLRQTPSHFLPPNNRKRPAPFLRQFPVFNQNSACFSSSAAPRLTPLHNLRPTRARTHARQQLFDFCLHVFTRRAQFSHSQRIKCEGFCAFAFTAFRGFAPHHGAAIEQNAPCEKGVKERVKACEAHSFTHNKLNHNHLQIPSTV